MRSRGRFRGCQRRIALLVVAGLCGLLPAGAPRADDPEAELGRVARYQGEELYYSLEFLGSSMARGALVVGQLEEHALGRLLPIQGIARTDGVAALIYPMHDTGQSWLDPFTGLVLSTLKELDERGEQRSYEVTFGHDAYLADVVRIREEVTHYYQRLVPSNTHDALSWIYSVREHDLTPGSTQVYFVYDGWKLSRVTVTAAEGDDELLVGEEFIPSRRLNLYREVLESTRPLPMVQESAALPPTMWVQQTQSGEQVGDLWISLDGRRLPLQIEFSNALITVTARLERYRAPTAGY